MWLRLASLSLLLCLWPLPCPGAEGVLRGLQQWRGEVLLAAALEVAPEAVLEIAPGTRVRVQDAGTRFLVRGRLLVRGSETEPVEFDAPAGWGGIEFVEADQGSLIEYARFKGARLGISVIAVAPALRHNRFEGCEVGIDLSREADSLVEANVFEQNHVGLRISMHSSPRVLNNRFVGQKKSGIETSNDSRGQIEGNFFSRNNYGLALQQKFSGEVRRNEFRDNRTGLFSYQTQNATLIEDNLFEGNGSGIQAFSFSYPTIRDNRFIGNATALSNDQFGSALVEYNLFRDNGTAIHNNRKSSPGIRNNQFIGNGRALFCDYSSYPEVKHNNFEANPVGAELGIYQSADWERRAGSKALILQQAQSRGSRNPLLAKAPETFPEELDLSGNWWGQQTVRLQEAGTDANLEMFFDRRDKPEVTYPGYGDQRYRLDRIVYAPWLQEPVADAGPRRVP